MEDKKFIICPFGDIGMQAKQILNECYGIQEAYILDNHLCKFNRNIKPVSFLEAIRSEDYTIVLACLDIDICREIEREISQYAIEPDILILASVQEQLVKSDKIEVEDKQACWWESFLPKVGKYTSGPLIENIFVESIGAFCNFAQGSIVVPNHSMNYITTHAMLVRAGGYFPFFTNEKIKDGQGERWYFEGVKPKGTLYKTKRSRIGNDVWLGRNVIVTNGSNIGNGVIAGAGAVITKDVPDYAIVVGVPARIIRYRYLPEQIEALNKIAWWDWPDEVIRERYDDFYLPIDEFIDKYLVE